MIPVFDTDKVISKYSLPLSRTNTLTVKCSKPQRFVVIVLRKLFKRVHPSEKYMKPTLGVTFLQLFFFFVDNGTHSIAKKLYVLRYENIYIECDLMIKRDKQFDNDLISPAEIMLLLFFVYFLFFAIMLCGVSIYSKTCVNGHSQTPFFAYAGQKCCKILQGEYSAILLTLIKLLFVVMIFVLTIYEWPFYTGFTVFAFKVKRCVKGQFTFSNFFEQIIAG